MPMKFTKAGVKAAAANEKATQDTGASHTPSTTQPKKLGFLKKGSAAKELFETAEAQAELRKQAAGKTFRFFIADSDEHKITFLDGDLDDEGMPEAAMYYEHQVSQGGKWPTYVCTADEEEGIECPICKEGTYPNYFAAALTILDHTPYKKKDNTIVKVTKKLYVMKLGTYKQLAKFAAKRGGLAGCTFEVSRSNDKAPRVGDTFDFIEKIEDGNELMAKYGLKAEDLEPLNYEEEIAYLTPEELTKLGVGTPVSKSSGGLGKESELSDKDFSSEL